MESKLVDIRRLKVLVTSAFPPGSSLRGLLMLEQDKIEAGEFLVKMEDWLRLLDLEQAVNCVGDLDS